MNLYDSVVDYVESQYGTTADFPFEDDNVTAVFRHASSSKWYALIMRIPYSKLDKSKEESGYVINLKCDPFVADSLVSTVEGIYPAYHMNHRLWISVLLDGTVSIEEVCKLIDLSYDLTKGKR